MNWYKNFVVYWTIIFMSIAVLGRVFSESGEFFPFFRWSLFSKTPNELVIPFVMVTKLDGVNLKERVNITAMYNHHHINPVTMDLNVNKWYKTVVNKTNKAEQTLPEFITIFSDKSEFLLCTKALDLTKSDYNLNVTLDTILMVKNKTITYFENAN
ncbi:hypothetical protein FNB79_00610 [Formosa sediminum]|uniref:Uncharacterized protein n=1 Tax=Formosa sediminum TaxID=2594004 RepID=A0A516GLY9_9FLAO|nr:hypothetical protein [Formosa sediminum]QDO92544.1 hypothetical protein FNB79_00610 [Formosa sediminum]